jgi:hypothetical protein
MKTRATKRYRNGSKRTVPRGERLESQIRESCLQMLMPLAGIMLRAGIGAGELSDLCRRAFVLAAADELSSPHRRLNVSRIAVATGLTRQEVARLLRAGKGSGRMELKQLQRANRVLAGWYEDPRYTIKVGVPRPLNVRGAGLTFQQLVRTYGGDVPPRAVLDELRRATAIRVTPDGAILPRRRSVEYGAKSQKALREAARKLRRLAETLNHNVNYPTSMLFEDVALSERLKAEHYPIAVRRISASARRFLSAAKLYLGRDERLAVASKRGPEPRRLGVGIFLFSNPS